MSSTVAQEHLLAAERAEEATLWDDAVREYEAALSAAGEGGGGDDAAAFDEAEALTRLGACYWNLAEARTAWRTLRRAISLYQQQGDGVGVARATVELLRIWGPPERHEQFAREALEALGDADPHLRARLLMRLRWAGSDQGDAHMQEALAIAEAHGFDDVLAMRANDESWLLLRNGRFDEGLALQRRAFEMWVRGKQYDNASGALRGSGFAMIAFGALDQGLALASECVAYSRSVHLRFTESLALTDSAGVLFARGEYDRCRALLDELPSSTDFRADLYRMWIVELSGDVRSAVSMMVNPERGGSAPTAMSQTHCAAAGVLFHAGSADAARHEMRTWFEIAREHGSIVEEVAPMWDCVVGLADDDVVREIHDALTADAARPAPTLFSTLQGRAIAPARGAIALRLGFVDEAEAAYRDGAAWCGATRVPMDEGLCRVGLADVARARADADAERDHLAVAAAIFETHAARLWIDRLIAARV